jgi:hypothetical protein
MPPEIKLGAGNTYVSWATYNYAKTPPVMLVWRLDLIERAVLWII